MLYTPVKVSVAADQLKKLERDIENKKTKFIYKDLIEK